ncbi:MAG: DUF3082 domain-containing protein [Desmonostoc geniculatum HA4340-LM1]|jgi:hypothetical protein|nr:DUF3082 domain-containing protein [Nostoc calcicola FACHB-3891]MBW4674744.1 DUF3082 domain-containing protein [Desmonostoc geniculatum HA4340-LM1]MDZ8061413.1 DUF3082 domain-containing protein [Nostoc sp. EkiNYC01]OKH31087.1 hypothetical protein FACHB389_22410 [Nostoc calcicola FACHB-389]
MTDQNLTPKTDAQVQVTATPLRSIIGAVISGGMAFAMYSLMISIATNFASKPLHSINPLVIKITSAVRTLVVGVVALGSGIFGIVAIGLLALTLQLLVQQFTKPKSSEN